VLSSTLDTRLVVHEIRDMRNVTISLDEETARWARVEAARRDVSMSTLLRQVLEDAKAAQESYPDAMERFLSRPSMALKRQGSYPHREELHDRARLR
jgi:hypothetical protein